MQGRVTLPCVLFLVAAGSAGAAAASPPTFTRGFVDSAWFDAPADGISHQSWLTRTRAAGARLEQIEVDWTGAEPDPPTPEASLTSPSAPQFNFGYLDQEVEEVHQAGLQPVFLVTELRAGPRGPAGPRASTPPGATGPTR